MLTKLGCDFENWKGKICIYANIHTNRLFALYPILRKLQSGK